MEIGQVLITNDQTDMYTIVNTYNPFCYLQQEIVVQNETTDTYIVLEKTYIEKNMKVVN